MALQRFVERDRATRDALSERLAVDKLHHNGPAEAGSRCFSRAGDVLFDAVDLRDV